MPKATPNGSQWIDAATAAAIIGISPRAVQRRCKSGQIAARLMPTPTGQQWQIDSFSLGIISSHSHDRNDSSDTQSRDTDDRNDTSDTQAATGTTPATEETTETTLKSTTAATPATETTPQAATPTTAMTQAADTSLMEFQLEATRREVESKAEEIRFLRGLVEQRDRDAAERVSYTHLTLPTSVRV